MLKHPLNKTENELLSDPHFPDYNRTASLIYRSREYIINHWLQLSEVNDYHDLGYSNNMVDLYNHLRYTHGFNCPVMIPNYLLLQYNKYDIRQYNDPIMSINIYDAINLHRQYVIDNILPNYPNAYNNKELINDNKSKKTYRYQIYDFKSCCDLRTQEIPIKLGTYGKLLLFVEAHSYIGLLNRQHAFRLVTENRNYNIANKQELCDLFV